MSAASTAAEPAAATAVSVVAAPAAARGVSGSGGPAHLTPKRRKLVPLREHLAALHRGMPGGGSSAVPRTGDVASGHAAAPSSSSSAMAVSAPIQLTHAPAGSTRRHARCPLEHIDPSYTAMSGLCAASEVGTPRGGSIRIQHVTAAAAAAASAQQVGPTSGPSSLGHAGVPGPSSGSDMGSDGPVRFPRLDECAHFHYENVELGPLQVRLYEEELKALQEPTLSDEDDGPPLCVQVCSNGRAWLLRRAPRDFRSLDAQLHRCVWDRKFSALPDLDTALTPESLESQEECARRVLSAYLARFSSLAGSLINCGPVLSWLELDNRGRRLIVTEDNAINTPAVAAAYAVRRYVAQAADEISFEVGDMISVIDMPPPQESIWWRGKRGFEVGFFPCDSVAVIGDKVPKNLHLTAAPASSASNSAAPVMPMSAGAAALPSKPVLRKHGKLIAFFRSFILNRPSRRRLKQSGILKERVFGCDLGEHLLNSGHEIPMVLKCCAEFIESSGIVDGIYRLSGVNSNIQKLRNAFDEDRIPALYEDESILQDIHSVASLLKMYFRELPNPLCTYQLYPNFVAAVQAKENERLLKMREAVQKLPPPHYRTLEYLIRHLSRVASRGVQTGMTPRNVAIVWAPNLLRCKELEVGGLGALQGVGVQAVVTEFLVCCCELIFCDSLPAETDTPAISEQAVSTLRRGGARPKSLAISTPTKLLSLEEARSRALQGHLALSAVGQDYIEVGGGPTQLPGKYHTVLELPGRKRGSSLKAKRSPLGWRSLFGGSGGKASRPASASKQRKSATPTDMEQAGLQCEVLQTRRPLRPVKSAESLGSSGGGSARNSAALELCEITSPQQQQQQQQREAAASPESPASAAGPLPCLSMHTSFLPSKPSHNRSVSHDSYFDLLSSSQPEDEGEDEEGEGSLDLSEIQLNFELEESEMRIFSEDETLASGASPATSSHHSRCHRPGVPRARFEELSMSSADPSPKKNKKSGSNSPGSRKRSRTITPHSVKVDEMRFIDSQSPEPVVVPATLTTAAEVHEETSGTTERFPTHTRGCSSGSSGLTTPGSPPRYAPLLSEAPSPLSPTTEPAGSLEGLYENIAAGDWESVSPDVSLVYQNVIPVTPTQPRPAANDGATLEETIYEDVAPRLDATPQASPQQENVDPEEVYQQVKAFRRSVAEVNELMLRAPASSSPPAEPESRKSWSPAVLPADSEELRRRFDSEIGRDIVRERRMRTELARVRADSVPNSPVPSPSILDRAGSSSLQMSPTSSMAATGTEGGATTAAPLLPSSEGSLTSLSSASFDPLSGAASPISPLSRPHLGASPSPLSPSPLSSPERVMCSVGTLQSKRRLSAEARDASFSSSQLSPESPPRVVSATPRTSTTCKLVLSPILSSGSECLQREDSLPLSSPDQTKTAETSPGSLSRPHSLNLSSPERVPRTSETSPGSLSRPHSLNLSSPERVPRTSETSPGSLSRPHSLNLSTPERASDTSPGSQGGNSRPPSVPTYSLISGEPSPVDVLSPCHRDLITGEVSPTRHGLQGPLSPQRSGLQVEQCRVTEEQCEILRLASPFEVKETPNSLASNEDVNLVRPTTLGLKHSETPEQSKESSQNKLSSPEASPRSPQRPNLEYYAISPTRLEEAAVLDRLSPQREEESRQSPLNSRATCISAAVSSLGSASASRPASLSISSPEPSASTKSSPISPEQIQDEQEDVELRVKNEDENDSESSSRPKSAPSSTVRVHLTLTSRRSSEPPAAAKTLSLADTRRLSNRKASVRELLSQFEEVGNTRPLPPCLRARACKSKLAKSLDEERFAEHALVRVRTSPDVTTEQQHEQQQSEEHETSQPSSPRLLLPVNLEDPERRERIEKYKEERRNFLREKYRSESFREQDGDDIVARLKQKTALRTNSEDATPRARSQSESGPARHGRNKLLHSPTETLREVSENTPPT